MSEVIVKSAGTLWAETLSELKLQMTRATFNQWLAASTAVRLWGNELTVAVANEMAQDWLMHRQRDTIERTLSAMAGEAMTIKIVTREEEELDSRLRVPPLATVVYDATLTRRPPPPPAPDDPAVYGRSDAELRESIAARKNGKGKSARPEPEPEEDERVQVEGAPTRERALPHGAYLKLSHYAVRFWQPALGHRAFTAWQVINSFKVGAGFAFGKWNEEPKIKELMASADISNYKMFEEALTILEGAGLLVITKKEGKRSPKRFEIRDFPIMTFDQHVDKLAQKDAALANAHIAWLKRYAERGFFDYDKWRAGADPLDCILVKDFAQN
jgi:hypothetical protein